MTRAERLEQTEARALARLAVEQRRLAQVQAARREEALLEGLLSDVGGPPGTSVHGCAQAAPGVAAVQQL